MHGSYAEGKLAEGGEMSTPAVHLPEKEKKQLI